MLRPMLLFVLGLALGLATAQAREFTSTQRGFDYAEKNCSECHAVEKGGGFSAEPRAPTFQFLADTPGVSWIALTAWLQRSHENMPDFIIPPRHREDLIAYILSLKESGRRR